MADKRRPAPTSVLWEKYLRRSGLPSIWCPGCGIGTTVGAMLRAIDRLGLPQDDVVIVTGIGCSGFIYNYLNFDGYHGTHGRALAAATGMKLANPKLKVIVPMGDGDCAAIGGNHFIHAARRNLDVTAIVINNAIYGMTGGQYSPLTPRASLATTAPYGHLERPFDLAELARAAGAPYVARTTTYHVRQLIDLIAEAIAYPGFAVVEVISQCPVQYGRRNDMPTAAEMLEWMRKNSVSVKAVTAGTAQADGRIVIGEIFREDPPPPEYTAQYEEMIERARARPRRERPALLPLIAARPSARSRWEVILAGIGGQGLALAGVILAEAAGIHEGRYVAQTETHSTNIRGGPSRSEVVISEEEIDYPAVDRLDVLLALTQRDVKLYGPRLKPDGLMVVDSSLEDLASSIHGRTASLPILDIARRQLGNEIVAGIIGLAAITTITGIVSWEALERAVFARVPSQAVELNRKALELGQQAARQWVGTA